MMLGMAPTAWLATLMQATAMRMREMQSSVSRKTMPVTTAAAMAIHFHVVRSTEVGSATEGSLFEIACAHACVGFASVWAPQQGQSPAAGRVRCRVLTW